MSILDRLLDGDRDLKSLKKTAATLEARRPVLQAALDEASTNEANADASLSKARLALADGSGDTTALMKASDEHQRRVVHRSEVERAVTMVEADFASITAEVAAAEHEAERQRQQTKADAILEQCDGLLDEQAAQIAVLWNPLKKRARLLAEINTNYPMATIPAPGGWHELAARAATLIQSDEFQEVPKHVNSHLIDVMVNWCDRSVAWQTPNCMSVRSKLAMIR
jgi:hypothetical protein